MLVYSVGQQRLRLRQILGPVRVEKRIDPRPWELNLGEVETSGPGVHFANFFDQDCAAEIVEKADGPEAEYGMTLPAACGTCHVRPLIHHSLEETRNEIGRQER